MGNEINLRTGLADKMEVVGQIFEIAGLPEVLGKYEAGMDTVKFNAVTIQVSSLLLRKNKALADRIIAMTLEETDESVQEMDDGTYAAALRNAIIKDVLGFFASSPRTAGQK